MVGGTVFADIVCYKYLTISGSSQSDGVNLLTDYVPKSNTVIRAKYASSNAGTKNANQFLFCSRLKAAATADALNFCYAANVSGKFRFDYYASQTPAASTFKKDRVYELFVSGGKAYVTDSTTSSVVEIGSGLQSFEPLYKLALFQSYTYSSGSYTLGGNSFHGKFYYLAIYDIENGEEVLKHRFVPCLDGGVAKLCDVANSDATFALAITGDGNAAVGGGVDLPFWGDAEPATNRTSASCQTAALAAGFESRLCTGDEFALAVFDSRSVGATFIIR